MSDYSDLIARARTASETLQKGALRSDAHDAKMLNDDAELFDELADTIEAIASDRDAIIRNHEAALGERDARIDFLQDVLERAEQELKKAQK